VNSYHSHVLGYEYDIIAEFPGLGEKLDPFFLIFASLGR